MPDDIQVLPTNTSILVVDDLPVVRLSLRHILQKAGYACQEAASVGEALGILERQHMDLVLCDIEMPGGPSGVELVQALGPRIPEIAIVMVSAMDDTSLAIECIQKGAFGYV